MPTILSHEDYPHIEIPSEKRNLPLINTSDIVELIEPHFKKQYEHLMCISLDGNKIPLAIRIVAIGGRTQATLSIPDILRSVISDGAHGIILVHNHSIGTADHSKGDLSVMKSIRDAAALFQIILVDSIVIGNDGYKTISTNYTNQSIPTQNKTRLYSLLLMQYIEELGKSFMPVSLVALAICVFVLYINAINNASVVAPIPEITTLILLYPIAWGMKTGGNFVRILCGDGSQ